MALIAIRKARSLSGFSRISVRIRSATALASLNALSFRYCSAADLRSRNLNAVSFPVEPAAEMYVSADDVYSRKVPYALAKYCLTLALIGLEAANARRRSMLPALPDRSPAHSMCASQDSLLPVS